VRITIAWLHSLTGTRHRGSRLFHVYDDAMARLLSINVGLPRDVAWRDQTVRTGIWKSPVQGRRMARRLNIDGDGQGDLAGHGGEQRAVLVYQIESYQFWQKQLRRIDFTYGQFGENLTVDGLPDRDVCVGDRYRIGGALFEVTQPRVTCYRVGIRLNEPQMAALLVAHARPGFYCRVLEEGELQAGDDIIQVAAGPERMSVADINALLYRPSHPPDQLMRALRITALSPGWKASFKALLEQEQSGATTTGNAGLARQAGPPPGWRGFRPLRVARKIPESSNVVSLVLEPADGSPLATALPGQFVVLRLKPAPDLPVLLRSYSLSGEPSAQRYRVSIKREAQGAAGAYIHDALQAGDVLDVSAARGSFTLRPGDRPVVLLSAGIGITPVLAMLHELAASSAAKPVWWLHGARNRREHPFVQEARTLVAALAHGRSHICYSSPDPEDRPGHDFDARGHLDLKVLQGLGLPHDAEFYICGPAKFMSDLTAGLLGWGVAPSQVHTELFGAEPASTPGIAVSSRRSPHAPSAPAGSGPQVSFARSGLSVRWGPSYASVLELAEACDVPVRWSCRTGVCHSCETALVEGAVNYAPDPIDAPGDGNVLICCSQPRGDIVVDL
jgi:ferredoxin-NADP reductase/MOSC domain-containing protein YiiM